MRANRDVTTVQLASRNTGAKAALRREPARGLLDEGANTTSSRFSLPSNPCALSPMLQPAPAPHDNLFKTPSHFIVFDHSLPANSAPPPTTACNSTSLSVFFVLARGRENSNPIQTTQCEVIPESAATRGDRMEYTILQCTSD
jgi:hypothetical protein